jgi:hypothetical protein
MGLVFQMPTLAYFLAKIGVVTSGMLIAKLRHAVLGIVILAALVTPSADPWNQLILSGTMFVLYAVCIAIVAAVGRGRRTQPAPGNGASVPVLMFPAEWWYSKYRQAHSVPRSRAIHPRRWAGGPPPATLSPRQNKPESVEGTTFRGTTDTFSSRRPR